MPWLCLHFGKPSTVLRKPLLCTLIEDACLAERSSLRSIASWEFCSQTQLPEQYHWGMTSVQAVGGKDGKMQRVLGGPALSSHPVAQSFSPAPGTV